MGGTFNRSLPPPLLRIMTMLNTEFSTECAFINISDSRLTALEASTQIQFRMPAGGPSFRPGILKVLECATQIEFQQNQKSRQSIATVESITDITLVTAPALQL